ncbi:MAG: tetratricopeptide repeat protein [Bryobacteraceae bacterium]
MYLLAIDQIANAQAALDAGRLAEARVLLESMPGDGRAAALLARVYFGLKMPGKAAAVAGSAERMGGVVPAVQHMLALYFAQSGQRKLAAVWEGRFARSKEADGAAALRAALLFAEVSDWPEAISFGRMALANGDRADLRLMLGRGYEATGKPDLAVEQYRALLVLLPYDEPSHAAFGQALLRMGRFNEAAAFLAEARGKFDKSPQIELAYGVALYTQRRFGEAGERFLRVIDLAPETPQPYIFLARMIDQLPERVPEIRARAEAWLRMEPTNGFAPFVVARAGLADAEAKPLILEAMRRDATVWEFPFELGQLLERARDLAGAAAAYEKAVLLNAQVPEPHYRLARVYDRLGMAAKAARERSLHQKLLTQPKGGMR